MSFAAENNMSINMEIFKAYELSLVFSKI